MNRRIPWLVTVALLAGCAVGPDYQPPQTTMPDGWIGSSDSAAPVGLATWWQIFRDPKLTALMNEALRTNLDIQLAAARVREARFSRGIIAGGLWPAVNASASYQRTRQGSAGEQNLFQTGLDALWEADIFGGIRRNVESAEANILAAQEGLHDVQVSLAAEVALNYVQLRGFQQQIAIARDNLEAQRHTADITRQRFNAGFVSGLDVANANAQVAATESTIPVLQTSARQSIYALSVLLARPPADLLNELAESRPQPVTPPEVPVGLPSELLRRRPDIRQAEAKLHAATAQIGVAVADFFPTFSLTGSLNWRADKLSSLSGGDARSWAFGPSVNWPIFQGGSIAANVRLQEALRDQAYITYRKTVLAALQDVENALIAYAKEWEHNKSLNDAVTANRKAVRISTQLYTEGQTDFLNVLQSQRALYLSQTAYVQSDTSLNQDLIALYKALGGGWDTAPAPAPPGG
jgi:outer membrane protein, multidrug efflux system